MEEQKEETKSIGLVDTAKLIRKQLKQRFPQTKFSVRSDSYSMGSNINISYKDGAPLKEVQELVSNYAGCDFDGMIDLEYYRYAWLNEETGEARLAESDGTIGNGGSDPAFKTPKPEGDGWVKAGFGVSYVFAAREFSEGVIKAAQQAVADDFGKTLKEVEYDYSLDRRVWGFLNQLDLQGKNSLEEIKAFIGEEIKNYDYGTQEKKVMVASEVV